MTLSEAAAAIGEAGSQQESAKTRKAALRLLAQREHGWAELEGKLLAKGFPAVAVAEALPALRDEGLQSDARFAAALVRRRIDRGYGPAYIRQELRSREVRDDLAETQLNQPDEYWAEIAQRALAKKFPEASGAADAPKGSGGFNAAEARFLTHRGFSADVIHRVLANRPAKAPDAGECPLAPRAEN